jgi:hypothetical protein
VALCIGISRSRRNGVDCASKDRRACKLRLVFDVVTPGWGWGQLVDLGIRGVSAPFCREGMQE